MKIGVLSDSHHRVDLTKDAIDFLKKEGIEYLIHAGDLCKEDNLKLLQDSKLPYVTVFGNNDGSLLPLSLDYNIKKEPYLFKIKNIKFKLMHLPFYMNGDSDVVIFGHTHIFESDFKNNTFFLNPGEICAREKPLSEFVLLDIDEKRYLV
ncbi:MAG: YfcE family phosphodiesterase, partial [Campylobacterales bacterium]|nr:YfcE family phosphodiesterase [Campylobacterales bacterium]